MSASLDHQLRELARGASNDAIDAAARIAKAYGADAEVVAAILTLKSTEKEAA